MLKLNNKFQALMMKLKKNIKNQKTFIKVACLQYNKKNNKNGKNKLHGLKKYKISFN